MKLQLIFARARNGVIGKDNALPWHLPEDMAHFKRLTQGGAVIMGRKTWDSIPARFRPLPQRLNVVVTRQHLWSETGAQAAHSMQEALLICENHRVDTTWIIGGAQLYALALPLASAAVVTEIDADFEGDAFAPVFGPHWVETSREAHTARCGLHFSFASYHNTRTVR